jgi:potassium-transporting ATPase potassium-binding subunit
MHPLDHPSVVLTITRWQVWLLPVLAVAPAVLLSLPVGLYAARIVDGCYARPRWLRWCERRLDTGPQNWKQYAASLLLFNTLMFVVGFLLLALQPWLALNPDGKGMLCPTTIFNTVISFQSNTSLQHYAGEQHLSYFSQLTAILWNMFVSGTTGLCALAAVTRGFRGDAHLGNYYVDMWRLLACVVMPAALVFGVLFLGTGVPMTFEGAEQVTTLEVGAMGTGDNGDPKPQAIARGPVAAMMPIKHLASVGGGFFGANSAHPFENPNAAANFLSCLGILLFPCAAVVQLGKMLRRPRHAAMIYGVMLAIFVGMVAWTIYWDTLRPNQALSSQPGRTLSMQDVGGEPLDKPLPALPGLPVDQGPGNLEGKELRFGASAGPTFAAITTAVACGSVNCAHDSLNPLAGLTPFTGMWLNCVFGGKGIGVLNLLVFIIVAIFLTGQMVGRTPEYLGKKVEAREMKLAMLALLVHPLLILGPTGLFAALEWGRGAVGNPGPHGFSEILYEFSSSAANNGSGFEGLADTHGLNDNPAPAPYSPHWDIATGLVMLLGRFVPIIAVLALAASLAAKRPTPSTVGTLRTDTLTFGLVLLGTILLVGALLFLPAAILGPMAEHLGPFPFGG